MPDELKKLKNQRHHILQSKVTNGLLNRLLLQTPSHMDLSQVQSPPKLSRVSKSEKHLNRSLNRSNNVSVSESQASKKMRKFKSQKNDISVNVQPTKNKLLKHHNTIDRTLNYSAMTSGLKPPASELRRNHY
jgi:hypothetical protein